MIAVARFEPFCLWHARCTRPKLAGRSLVAVDAGRVVSVSSRARRAGITPGMTLAAAQLRDASLIAVPVEAPLLSFAWHDLLRTLYHLTPFLEPLSLGRAALQLTLTEAEQLAGAHKVPVGLAASVEPAFLAALAAYPGRVRTVMPEAEASFLERLPLYFLRGVGLPGEAVERLAWLGVRTVGQLACWPPARLRAFLGRDSACLLPFLYGPKRTTLNRYQLLPSVSVTHAFDEPQVEPYALLPVLWGLAERAVTLLAGRAARHLRLTATADGLAFRGARLAKTPLKAVDGIYWLAVLALGDSGAAGLGIVTLTLELTQLSRESTQGRLWRQRENVAAAVQAVSERYPSALLRIETGEPDALAPERAYRLVRLGSGEEVPWAQREDEQREVAAAKGPGGDEARAPAPA